MKDMPPKEYKKIHIMIFSIIITLALVLGALALSTEEPLFLNQFI